MEEDQFAVLRHRMIEMISAHAHHAGPRIGKGQLDDRVLEVMKLVHRHDFVPSELRAYAYFDTPLPIGYDKTVSQPFMVALMTDLLRIGKEDTVLEVGTGLGYHSAVLSKLAAKVYTIEIIEELGVRAKKKLRHLGCDNVEIRIGDGSGGWPEHAPFDAISVAAAPDLIPPALITQLKAGGRMICPAGLSGEQQLLLVQKSDQGKLTVTEILPVSFTPLETAD